MRSAHAFRMLAIAFALAWSAACSAGPGAVYGPGELRDGYFMRDWLLCGPFPNPGTGTGINHAHDQTCAGFFRDYLAGSGGEPNVAPKAGEVVAPDGVEPRTWFFHRAPHVPGQLQRFVKGHAGHITGDVIAFHRLWNPTDDMVAYAACTVVCDRDQTRLFGLGSDDGVRIWLNGREVWRFHETGGYPRSVGLDDDYVRMTLRKGTNRLLLKIDNGFGGWGFEMRPVSDAVARAWVMANARERLALRFRVEGRRIIGCFGSAIAGFPPGRVAISTPDGRVLARAAMPLGREVSWPVSAFPPNAHLRADGEFVAPGYPRFTTRVHVPTYDVIALVRGMLAQEFPAAPPSRRALAIARQIDDIRQVERTGRFWSQTYAYERIRVALGRLRGQLTALAAPRATACDGLFPVPKRVIPRPGACAVDGAWTLVLPASGLPESACASLVDAWTRRFGAPPARSAAAGARTVTVSVAPLRRRGVPADAREAFVLETAPDRVIIHGATPAGAAYGIDTLAQLIEQDRPVPCVRVLDWPAYPTRSVSEPQTPGTDAWKRNIDTYARLRYNQVMVSVDFANLHDPDVARRAREIFAYCRERFIEPLPSIETFGGGSIAEAVDPDIAEGIYEPRRPFAVGPDGCVRIPELRILDTVTARPVVEDAAGRRLRRTLDYDVESKSPPVLRFHGAAAAPGTKVRISYDWFDRKFFRFPASCPSDPRRWPYIDRVIGNIFRVLGSTAIHLGQDEGGYLNRDSRCLARHTTPRKLMAEQFLRTVAIVRKYSPKARIYLWGDEFNPFQNAFLLGGSRSAEDLPKDVIVVDWAYAGASYNDLRHLENSARHFARGLGLRIVTSSWYDPLNVVHLARMGRTVGRNYLGMLYTCWDQHFEGRDITAYAAWQGATMLGDFQF